MASDVMAKLHAAAAADRAKQAAAAKKAASRTTSKTSQRQARQSATVRPSGATGGAGGSGGGTQAGSGASSNHDCGPWIEATNSSRVREYRYDYGNGQLQVRWTNTRGKHRDQTIYQCGDADTGKGGTHIYRAFAQAVSKGKYVNNVFNESVPFWPGDDVSFNVPSNPNRGDVRHKP